MREWKEGTPNSLEGLFELIKASPDRFVRFLPLFNQFIDNIPDQNQAEAWVYRFRSLYSYGTSQERLELELKSAEILYSHQQRADAFETLDAMGSELGVELSRTAHSMLRGDEDTKMEENYLRYFVKGVHLIHRYETPTDRYVKDLEFAKPIIKYSPIAPLGYYFMALIYHDLARPYQARKVLITYRGRFPVEYKIDYHDAQRLRDEVGARYLLSKS